MRLLRGPYSVIILSSYPHRTQYFESGRIYISLIKHEECVENPAEGSTENEAPFPVAPINQHR